MIRKTRYFLVLALTVALAIASAFGAPLQNVSAAAPDVSVVATPSSVVWDEASPGNSFTLHVTNTPVGGITAPGPITIVAPLTSVTGITYFSFNANGSGFDCGASTGTNISCTYTANGGNMANGYDMTFSVTVNVSSAANNTGSISIGLNPAVTGDGNNANDNTSLNYTINKKPNFQISRLVHKGDNVNLGSNFTTGNNGQIIATVKNQGDGISSGTISLNVSLPAGFTFVSTPTGGWSCAGSAPTACLSSNVFNPGDIVDVVLVVTPPGAAINGLSDTAVISGGGEPALYDTNPACCGAPYPDNHNAEGGINVVGNPSLTVVKSHTTNPFMEGATGNSTTKVGPVYRFVVTNIGGGATTSPVTLTETLPGGLTYANFDNNSGFFDCSASSGANISCTSNHTFIALTGTETLDIGVTVPYTGAAQPSFTNHVNVATTGSPTNGSNNNVADSSGVTNIGFAALVITKSHTDPFFAGFLGTSKYTVLLTNNGSTATAPVIASTIVITDTLPLGIKFGSVSGVNSGLFTCAVLPVVFNPAVQQVVTCNSNAGTAVAGTGGTLTFDINVTVDKSAGASLSNHILVHAPTTGSPDSTFDDPTTIRRADLTVSKTVSPTCTSGSGNCSFVITVANVGTAKLPSGTTVTVTDTLPPNVLFVPPSSGTGWNLCSHTGANPDVVTCTALLGADLPGSGETPPPAPNANKMNPITINVNPANPANNAQNLVAVAENALVDNNAGNDNSTLTFNIGQPPFADIEVFKQAQISGVSTTSFTVNGANQSYHIQIRDLSAVTALAGTVQIQDVLPTGVTLIGAANLINTGVWTCGNVGSTINCTNTAGAITPGPLFTFNIPVLVSNTATNPTANTATFLPGDGNATNDQFSTSTAINPQALPDLTVSKTHPGNFLSASVGNIYTVTVHNIGAQATSNAATITVTDTLPAGFIATAGGNGTWICSTAFPTTPGGTVSCQALLALTAVTGTSSFPITVTAPTVVSSTNFTNNVSVATTESESNTGNNTGSDLTTVTLANVADLKITKTHTDPCVVNQNCIFTIQVQNIGTGLYDSAVGGLVSVQDTLPAGFVFQSGGGSGSWNACTAVGQVVTCVNTTTTIAAGVTLGNLTITAAPGNGTITGLGGPGVNNTAAITNSFGDPSPANNTVNDAVHVVGAGDLKIIKVATQAFQFSQPGSYTITVQNIGTAPVTGTTTVTDTLATGLTFTSGSGSSFACSAILQAVTCTRFVDFAVNETATITLNITVAAAFTPGLNNPVSNTANVANATDTDAYLGANTSTTSTPISNGPAPDLTLPNKTHAGNLVANQNTTYQIVVRNAGSANENGTITVTDTLNANLTFVSGNSAGGFSCSSGTPVTCIKTGLAAGASDTINLIVHVNAGTLLGTTITNQAHVAVVPNDEAGTSNNDSPVDSAVTTNTPSVDATQSSVCVAPASGLPANNTAMANITVTVKDGTGAALPGLSVQLNVNPASGITLGGANPAISGAGGVATFTATAAVAATYNFTAVVSGVTIGPSGCGSATTFGGSGANSVNLNNSSVSASPTSLAADGVASSTVSVHIADNNNLSLAGVGITLTYTTNTGNTTGITPASGTTGTTDSSGNATFSLKSTTNQIVTITISGTFNSAAFTLTQHPAVTFGTGGTSTTVATSTFTTNYISIPADLVTTATLTATLKDASGNGVSGKTITVAGASSPAITGMTISPASVVTDSNGSAVFTVRSSQQGGPVTFTATNVTDGNVALSQTVQITFTAPGTAPVAAPNSTLTPGVSSGAIVIARLLCIRTGPGFGYARYPSALKFNTPVTVLGKTTRVPGTAVRDNCIHIGGPTWFLMQIPGGGIVWGNANFVRIGRIAFRNLPVLPPPPAPGAAGAAQAAINGPVTSAPSGQPTATPTAHP